MFIEEMRQAGIQTEYLPVRIFEGPIAENGGDQIINLEVARGSDYPARFTFAQMNPETGEIRQGSYLQTIYGNLPGPRIYVFGGWNENMS